MSKLKIAFHWLASCGGCEISLLDIDEVILDLAAIADIVFMPLAVDGKWSDIFEMDDKTIDISFINGAVRSSDHIHELELLQKKSKLIIAYGQCSVSGGIIGLGNTKTPEEILKFVYKDSPSTNNQLNVLPQESVNIENQKITLPILTRLVSSIDEIIEVDYYIAGCPPPVPVVISAILAIKGNKLPPKGSFIGTNYSVCDECEKTKSDRRDIKIDRFVRPHEALVENEEQCLLEQGIVCLGPVTRGGCSGACPTVNMPCRGCLGVTPDTKDPSAKMISVISQFSKNMTQEEAQALVESVVDPVGTFYRFSFPKSVVKHALYKEVKQ